jgi:hypothetical protein
VPPFFGPWVDWDGWGRGKRPSCEDYSFSAVTFCHSTNHPSSENMCIPKNTAARRAGQSGLAILACNAPRKPGWDTGGLRLTQAAFRAPAVPSQDLAPALAATPVAQAPRCCRHCPVVSRENSLNPLATHAPPSSNRIRASFHFFCLLKAGFLYPGGNR